MGEKIELDKGINEDRQQKSCFTCRHLINFFERTCNAFPEGVPDKIWKGDHSHSRRLSEQDNNITYIPIEDVGV